MAVLVRHSKCSGSTSCGGINRGVYNSDEISNVGWEYDRDVVNAIHYRLSATRDVLRALILDLKVNRFCGTVSNQRLRPSRYQRLGR